MKKSFWFLLAMVAVLTIGGCSLEQACTSGEKRCEGGKLLICSSGGTWEDAWDCDQLGQFCNDIKGCIACRDSNDCKDSEKPVCNEKMNVCLSKDAKCAKGEMSCDGNALSTCNEIDNVFVKTICADSSFCDVSKGCIACRNSEDCTDTTKPVCNKTTKSCQAPDAVCAQGETICEKNYSFGCAADGQWDVNGTACNLGCNSTGTGCAECSTNEKKCEKSQAYVCSAGGWVEIGNTCKDGCNGEGTACGECAKGEIQCIENAVSRCNATQSGFDKSKCNISTPICDEVKGCVECRNNTHCKTAPRLTCNTSTKTCVECSDGGTKCVINQLYTCSRGIWGTASVRCEKGCNAAGMACAVCLLGETKCELDQSTTCSTNGDWLDSLKSCSIGCNAAGTACAACLNGTKQCINNKLSTCVNENWGEGVACQIDMVCRDGNTSCGYPIE